MNQNSLYQLLSSKNFKNRFNNLSILELDQKDYYLNNISNTIKQKTLLDITKKEPIWHFFSFQKVNCLSGINAINKYNNQYFKNFTIIPSNPKFYGIKCQSTIGISYKEITKILSENKYLGDLYISQTNTKWIFIVTHEKEFGPYFLHG